MASGETPRVADDTLTLDSPVVALTGIGPRRAAQLRNLHIETVRDLLFHFPRDYRDRSAITPIAEVEEGGTFTVEAEVVSARAKRFGRRMSMAIATVRDATGEINATWFGRAFLAKALEKGRRVLLTGEAGQHKGLALKNPDYEFLTGDADDLLNTGRIVPVYALTEKVTQRMMRKWVRTALDTEGIDFDAALPVAARERHGIRDVRAALETVHFPGELEATRPARRFFAYAELFTLQLRVLRTRAERLDRARACRHRTDGDTLRAFRAALPFELTRAQSRAVDDLLKEMAAPRPMGRLLQGDVGCGKTVVALHAVAAALDGGYQVALMAPTEVLAEQHYATMNRALAPLGIDVTLLTGATRGRTSARKSLRSGAARFVVGTHALIQDGVTFDRLGLVIVDEQHRFGVAQRLRLARKGAHPDILHMTATPIPRTLALTLYGAMDLTVIDEIPPGRKPVATRAVASDDADAAYAHAANEARAGRQAYIICPLVDESETRDATAVTEHFRELSSTVFNDLTTALLHGRMNADEKESVMNRFAAGDIAILFSTTVIEVGIDVPNAATMIIEEAGQFGLTQLHQLRGRVGRGDAPSMCFLMGDPKTEDAARRIAVMCETNDGFAIAEEDLTLRGPGEVYGWRQSGLGDLRVADLIKDAPMLDEARRDAEAFLADSASGDETTALSA